MNIAAGGSLLFLVAGFLLHFLDRSVDARSQGMSYYAAGRYRWLITTGFLAFAAAYAFLTPLSCLFAGAAIGMAGVAIFPTGKADIAHRLAANLFFLCAIAGALIISAERKSVPLMIVSATAMILYPLFAWPRMPCRGLLQRLCFLCLVVWILLLSRW